MESLLRQKQWSPYLVGVLIGLLSWVTFLSMDKALGVSTTFVRGAGVVEATLAPEYVKNTDYLAKYLVGQPAFEWQAALVFMLVWGALLARKLSGESASEDVPGIWVKAFGVSRARRYLGAFFGGVLILFGRVLLEDVLRGMGFLVDCNLRSRVGSLCSHFLGLGFQRLLFFIDVRKLNRTEGDMFETSFFSNPGTLVMGAITGLVFGFLLQKGRVTKFDTIVGQFLLTDFTVAKVMFTAIVVGSIGIYAMLGFGLIDSLHVKSATLLGNALGGCIFGVGMAILGYCPGTGVAALGDGAKDAVFGILGMFVGAALYAETYPWLKGNVLSVANLGKETLPTLSGVSPWLFVGALLFLLLAGSQFLKRLE